ncbi:predicted protein [Thalassiosira pseudonana CCMP1335]|uniref:Uncharacterized protein n=1 Tax=Thalassiosira pseudonana TaxID=35128 RepID=B8C9J0_THAPS|nr:predicted protein [Thalassiosira pseudonana CCMP1335]EED89868.1 predicted protein [Thalassiosira pseudonana CCMP1335]
MFFPPRFEPHSTSEPQWYPRPITDSIESNLDLLERLEEERRNRLRNIANVKAKVPIGLEAVASSSSANGAAPPASSGSLSPHPSSARATTLNNYSQHRYFPPPTTPAASSSIYHHHHRDRIAVNTTPASSRRVRHYRNVRNPRMSLGATPRSGGATPRSAASSHSSSSTTNLSHISHSNPMHVMVLLHFITWHLRRLEGVCSLLLRLIHEEAEEGVAVVAELGGIVF